MAFETIMGNSNVVGFSQISIPYRFAQAELPMSGINELFDVEPIQPSFDTDAAAA